MDLIIRRKNLIKRFEEGITSAFYLSNKNSHELWNLRKGIPTPTSEKEYLYISNFPSSVSIIYSHKENKYSTHRK